MLSWVPVPEEIHALMAARALPEGFGEDTTPTRDAVEAVIEKVGHEVIAVLGDVDLSRAINPSAPTGDRVTYRDLAVKVVALGAAAEVERSFFPEQQESEAEGSLFRQYREALTRLAAAAPKLTSAGRPVAGSVAMSSPFVDFFRTPDTELAPRLR